ncbi:MAG: histidine phosphatase family protein [Candidatus Heimdallarchaeota archaeon]|nr:histidine phosphatase family protein [Candidatus Heimdallarchaeota archaeon]
MNVKIMSSNTFFLLRHAQTEMVQNKKISEWPLTERGIIIASKLANEIFRKPFDLIYSSSEPKAIQTAKPFAEKYNLKIIQCFEFRELNRDRGDFQSEDLYKANVELVLKNRDRIYNNWETANNALSRFKEKFQEIDNENQNKKILIVSHGLILNLFFAHLLNDMSSVFKRWQTTKFCDYGIIDKGTVLKDITSLQ